MASGSISLQWRPARISIRHLSDVLDTLQKYHYSGRKLHRLAVSLGLLYDTLRNIERDFSDVERRLFECLSAWIRCADNVDKKGGPTWQALIAALESIDEKSVADKIYKEKILTCDILFRHSHMLTEHIEDLVAIAKTLFDEKMIEDSVRQLISANTTCSRKKELMLNAVEEAVLANEQNLEKFAVILKRFVVSASMGDAILKDYRELHFPDVSSEMITYYDSRGLLKICIPLSLNHEFKKIRIKFADFFFDVNQILVRRIQCIKDNFVYYLQFTCPHLKLQLNRCRDVADVLQIISENCSLIDISLLEAVVNKFDINEANEVIDQYKKCIEEFCQNIPHRLCQNEVTNVPLPSPSCEVAKFHVDYSVDDLTLKDMRILLKAAFERLSPNIKVFVIREVTKLQ